MDNAKDKPKNIVVAPALPMPDLSALTTVRQSLEKTVFPFMESIQPIIQQQLEMQKRVEEALAPMIRARKEIEDAMRPIIEQTIKAQEDMERILRPRLSIPSLAEPEMVTYVPAQGPTVVVLSPESVDQVVERVVEVLRGKSATRSGRSRASYPLPKDASWSKLAIKFFDGHTVKVKYHKLPTQTFDFKDMGFWNKKTNASDVKWEFLRTLAYGDGSLTVKKFDKRFNRTTKYETAQRLMEFFGMTENPFDDYRKEYGYRAKFVLLPDTAPMPEE